MNSIIQKFVELGHRPNDPKDERLRKSSLLVVSGPFALAGLIWGVLYFVNGLFIPGTIPFSYGLLSVFSIISFAISKQYKFFRNSQLFLILVLPFALQLSMGGFVPSSAVIYWAIIAPAGAMFFDSVKRSAYWFAAYLFLVITAYLINDLLPGYVDWNLSEDFVNTLFLMNIIGVSSIVFGILYYFVGTITKLNENIEEKNLALSEQSERLKEMDEIKSRFFANISHEFRTPLTLILGLVNKQISNASSAPEPKDSDTMKRNANRLLQLINQLLDLSKLESGGVKLQISKNDVVLFAKNSTSQFESMAAGKRIKLLYNGRDVKEQVEYETIELHFDLEKMQKVITNLLSNAIKFTPENGEVSVVVGVQKTTNIEPELVSIKVINTGNEIPSDKLPYIFDRFFQVDAASSRKYEGTGIGLALVKELVELHKGTVSVESKMRKTTFTVCLPLSAQYIDQHDIIEGTSLENTPSIRAVDTIVDLGINVADERVTTQGNDQLEVLVVEDNNDLRAFIKSILQQDYKVIDAVDGVDGIEKAEASIPDLIVSDVMMPRMDGYDLCKKLKTNDKTNHIPVILLTAKATRENKLEGLETGADDYLVKPFDEEELMVRIKNLISIREKLQRKFQGEIWLKPKEVKVSSVHQKFLEELKEIIESNIDNERFGMEDLEKNLGMSRSQIHRKLKALTDQSATTFIRNYRLHRAADLLKQDVGNITEIAFQVGFNSQTYFSSCFQELFQCSPSEYKQKELRSSI